MPVSEILVLALGREYFYVYLWLSFMRTIPLLVFTFQALSFLNAQTVLFQNGYGGTGDDMFRKAIVTSGGDIVAVGSTKSFGAGNWDVLLTKLDTGGNILWTKTLGTSGSDQGNYVSATSDGGYIIAGSTNGFGLNGDYDGLVIKTDSVGIPQWSVTYGGTLSDNVRFVKESDDGSYYACGQIHTAWDDLLLLKLNTNGNALWSKYMLLGGYSDAYSVTELQGGNILMTVTGLGQLSPFEITSGTLKISPSGNLLWRKFFGGTGDEYFYSSVYDGGGSIYSAGASNTSGAGGFDMYVVRSDTANGAMLSAFRYGTSATDYAYDIAKTQDGNYIVAGMTNYNSNSFSPLLIKIDPAGTLVWTKSYGTQSTDMLYSCTAPGNSSIVMAGYNTSSSADMSALLLRTDLAGDSDCNSSPIVFTSSPDSLSYNWNVTVSTLSTMPVSRTLSISSPSMDINNMCGTGIAEFNNTIPCTLFPNPSSGSFSLIISESTHENLLLTIFDLNGRIKKEIDVKNKADLIHVSELPDGIYVCKLNNEKSNLWNGKLVIIR